MPAAADHPGSRWRQDSKEIVWDASFSPALPDAGSVVPAQGYQLSGRYGTGVERNGSGAGPCPGGLAGFGITTAVLDEDRT